MEKNTNSTTDIPTESNKIYTKHSIKGALSLSILKNPILYTLKKAEHTLNHTESLPNMVQELCKSFVKHMQNDEKHLITEVHEEETTKTSENTRDNFIVNTRIKEQNQLDMIFDPPKEGIKIKHKQCQKMGKVILGLMRQNDYERITSECKGLEKKLIGYNEIIGDIKTKETKFDMEIRKLESCKKLLLKDIKNARKKQIQYYEDSALTNCADSGSVETSSFL
ncbi:hypothetical protein SteCoe_16929 [Stentor coeruleus]|uniref:Uncharacterized protein n=1 Tax=Stentor coeruleus TaxID=5963 RepID=A0A1R2C072_9CILI|nr:hypothetical protein SteCoe_16929 [Stentor coeruleus]